MAWIDEIAEADVMESDAEDVRRDALALAREIMGKDTQENETGIAGLEQKIKAETARDFPGVPGQIIDAAYTLAARKMIAYEKAKMPQKQEYMSLLIPDCVDAVIRSEISLSLL